MTARNPDLDEDFRTAEKWRREAEALRAILLDAGLVEERKWGQPCYTSRGRNICIIQRMNDFLALLFFKGALLEDPENLLEVQGRNSRSGYRMRFTAAEEVEKRAGTIRAYVREAVEKADLEVGKAPQPDYPDELVDRLDADPDLRTALEALTPGRRRGYILHFSEARQSETRARRIEKCRDRIMEGKGLNDR